MRPVLVMIVLAACSSAPPTGPAWPKLSPRADDGGESIAPREGARALAAIEEDRPAERATEAAAVLPEAAPGEAAGDKPTATTSPASDPAIPEELLMTEEIVIEVEGP
jgi:hypothetical protein